MAFDLEEFSKRLNSDVKLRDDFRSDPGSILKSNGLDLGAKELEQLQNSIQNITSGNQTNVIVPIVIAKGS